MPRPCTDTVKFLTPLQPDEAKAPRAWLRGRPQSPAPDPKWRLVTPLLGTGQPVNKRRTGTPPEFVRGAKPVARSCSMVIAGLKGACKNSRLSVSSAHHAAWFP